MLPCATARRSTGEDDPCTNGRWRPRSRGVRHRPGRGIAPQGASRFSACPPSRRGRHPTSPLRVVFRSSRVHCPVLEQLVAVPRRDSAGSPISRKNSALEQKVLHCNGGPGRKPIAARACAQKMHLARASCQARPPSNAAANAGSTLRRSISRRITSS